MSKPFLGRAAIIDVIKGRERTNAMQKREGLTDHPVRFTICGCPSPNCAGWHTVEMDRRVPSPEECAQIIRTHNALRRRKKVKRG
jgi:hypothetical protein